MATNTIDFNIPQNGYAAFDATGMRDLIVQRLNQQGVFTDQNYTGSNISTIVEIIAYTYHVLMFYLNQTSSESQYSQASIYENINKIVKALNYNPIGYQTPTLTFQCIGTESLAAGSYTIPRYSYFTLNGIKYSFNSDITFTKVTNTVETLSEISNQNLLYQGTFVEYPTYTATGDPFEQLSVAVTNGSDNVYLDHFNINVYVRNNTEASPAFVQYKPTESLFLQSGDSLSYEIRLNEHGRYEVKFGDNVHGKQLNTGDEVAIYYLQSDGVAGTVDVGALNALPLLFFNSQRYNTIINDTLPANLNPVTTQQVTYLNFSNTSKSTDFQDIESVESIRTNALNTFKTQYRLITTTDFNTFILKSFGNILASVNCVSNKDFVNGHLKYFFDLGIEKPSIESRIMLNQVRFGSSCNFNNVYIYCVPKISNVTSLNSRLNYLSTAQKQLISTEVQPYKLLTSELVYADPIYVLVDLGIYAAGEALSPAVADQTYLEIIATDQQQQAFSAIQQSAAAILQNYFNTTRNNLGLLIDVTNLSTQLQEILGVQNVTTVRVIGSTTLRVPGVSLMLWNPVYPEDDINITQQNLQLPYFKFPILNNSAAFINKIKVIAA
jgi:hypothetical protein